MGDRRHAEGRPRSELLTGGGRQTDQRDSSDWTDRIGWTVVGVAMAVLFAKVGGLSSAGYGWASWKPWTWRPGPLLRDTVSTGGDTGAHVWTPWFLRRNLAAALKATGWSKDWFAGFPVLHFYFPLPSWVIVAVGFVLPANIAFKLVTVAGVLSLPLASMFLAASLGLPRPHRYLFALASIVFLFDPHYDILGGNILSTMAGEFSFSISLSAAVVVLGLLARVFRTGRGRPLAVVAVFVAALSHLLPSVFAAVAALALLVVYLPCLEASRKRRLTIDLLAVGVVALLLVSFWTVPFAAHLDYSNDMGWETATAYLAGLFPLLARPSLTGAALMSGVVALAVLGAFVQCFRFLRALTRRHEGEVAPPDDEARAGMWLTLSAALSALAFRFPPAHRVLNERALPFYFLCCSYLAVFALAAIARKRRPATLLLGSAVLGWWSVGSTMAIVPGFVPIPKWRHGSLTVQRSDDTDDQSLAADWAKLNYDGYEAGDDWPELRSIYQTMDRVGKTNGCGRAMWDWEQGMDRYGSDVAFMLLPMRTDSCIGSMEGMYYESSATGPYHWINASLLSGAGSDPQALLNYPGRNVAEGVRHLQQLGVRYYMVFSPSALAEARVNPDLRLVASTPFDRECTTKEKNNGQCPSVMEVYEVARSQLVEGLTARPAVVTGIEPSQRGGWLDVAAAHYARPAEFRVPLAADGPAEWERVRATVHRDALTEYGARTAVAPAVVHVEPAVAVSEIHEGQGTLSFRVNRVGVPVVVKESYFPTWRAHGADGPWRLAPNLMVVIPTAKVVRLQIERDAADWLGLALAVTGLVGFVALIRLERQTRQRHCRSGSAEIADQTSSLPLDVGPQERWNS